MYGSNVEKLKEKLTEMKKMIYSNGLVVDVVPPLAITSALLLLSVRGVYLV